MIAKVVSWMHLCGVLILSHSLSLYYKMLMLNKSQCWRNILHTGYYHNKYTLKTIQKNLLNTHRILSARASALSSQYVQANMYYAIVEHVLALAWTSSSDYFIVLQYMFRYEKFLSYNLLAVLTTMTAIPSINVVFVHIYVYSFLLSNFYSLIFL